MKKWGLRILSALLTFTLGLGAATIVRIRLAPVAKVQPVSEGTNITERLPPPQVADVTSLSSEVDEVMQPHPVSISPYEIKRLIDENNLVTGKQQGNDLFFYPIWNQLGIKPSVASKFAVDICYGDCHAGISKLELDGKVDKEIILRVHKQLTWDAIYLIFKKVNSQGSKGGWVFLGYIEVFTWWNDPQLRVLNIGTSHWLVIEEVTGHGSGFGSDADNWYEVSERGVAPVLSYQTDLFAAAWKTSPTIERQTKVLRTDFSNGIATVVLQTTTSYKSWKEDDLLWTNQRKATFVKWPGMHKFSFDPLHSEMIEKELDPYFGDDVNITGGDFLKYNYRDLARIAARGNAKQKEWLRNYLDTCDESFEKQSLLTALGDS